MNEQARTPGAASPVAAHIDHTLLRADATAADIDALCTSALEHRFAAVCVNPVWVKRVARHVKGYGIAVAAVVDFPLGASTPEEKAEGARLAIADGATEIDFVIDIGAAKGGEWDRVADGARAVVAACRAGGALTKSILETSVLTPEEVEQATCVCSEAGVDYVKTSTGFNGRGASLEDIRIMKGAAGPGVKIKASGGIRSAADARKMLEAGADRIGTSAGVAIVQGWDAE
jgi:deoxyribose-phosphate aldolase